jgi:hypothetical protein
MASGKARYRWFVRECAVGQMMVKHLTTFIQTGPQVSVRGVSLSEQRLSRHRKVASVQ